LSFGHATEGDGAGAGSDGAIGAGAGSDGAIGAGAGFGVRFLAFALLAGFAFFIAFFIPFFLRAGAPRFAFLDFFATFNLPNRFSQNYATRYHAVAAYLNLWTAVLNLCTAVADCCKRQFECADGLLPVAVYLLQPFQQRVDESIVATERSRVDSPVMIIGQRNAEFVSPTHDSLLAGMQQGCQCLEADASDRVLQDQRIL